MRGLPLPVALMAGLAAGGVQATEGDDGATPEPAEAVGYLGLQVATSPEGARVEAVIPGLGAEHAGLSEGDLLLTADGVALGGMPLPEVVARLKGPPGSSVRLHVSRFPGGDAVHLEVTRGPAPAPTPRANPPLDPVEREVNVLVGTLRANRGLDLRPAVQAWTRAGDPDLAEQAAWRLFRQADALGGAVPVQSRHRFWTEVGRDDTMGRFLRAASPRLRLRAARLLARHRPSASLALALVENLPPDPLVAEATILARAVLTGDAAAVAALEHRPPDLLSEAWVLAFNAPLTDRVALELLEEQGTEDLRGALAPGAVARLEATGFPVPWEVPAGPAFGEAVAPLAPRFHLQSLDGVPLDPAAHPGPLAVAFWSVHCGPCMQELPRLQALAAELASTGFTTWALTLDRDVAAVEDARERMGLTLPVALAPPEVSRAWGVNPVPRLFVLDGDHRVVIDHTGYSEDRFPDLAREVAEVARGERRGSRHLGTMLQGPEGVVLASAGLADLQVAALAADHRGGLWASLPEEGVLAPVRRVDGRLDADTRRGIPLPFTADRVRFVDLDGDGREEVALARTGRGAVRLARRDGKGIWTTRSVDPVVELDVVQAEDGPRLVLLREDRARGGGRVEILDREGGVAAAVAVPEPVASFCAHQDRVLLLLADGRTRVVTAAGAVQDIPEHLDRVRGLHSLDRDGDGTPEVVRAGVDVRDVVAGRLGPGGRRALVAVTGGGDLVGLDTLGEVAFRLDLPRPPTALVVSDLDGDGREEAAMWVTGFGLAALQVAWPVE